MPVHYQHLAIEAFDQGLITEGRFADFLHVDRLEARRLAEVLREYSSGMVEEVVVRASCSLPIPNLNAKQFTTLT